MRTIHLTSSDDLAKLVDLLPANKGRQSLVTSLIKAYKLDELVDEVIPVEKVTRRDLELYHDPGFVRQLLIPRPELDESVDGDMKRLAKKLVFSDYEDPYQDDDYQDLENEDDIHKNDLSYGLSYDCYPFPFMNLYVTLTASSSISAARSLLRYYSLGSPTQPIAINWYGGRHHCTKRKAAGFCYVNDIILAISTLRKRFSKIFYLDLDLHHGDGVELGYEFSKKVTTCSIHRYDIGFYPGTGSLLSSKSGMYNIPTRRGLGDSSMMYIITEIVVPLIEKSEVGCIVIQGGVDGLGMDEHREWNMTINGYWRVIECIIDRFNVPVMIVGGGGYNHTETAKCWTYITAKLLNLDTDDWDVIPEHECLDYYEKDGYRFWTDENSRATKMKDENDDEYLQGLKENLLSII